LLLWLERETQSKSGFAAMPLLKIRSWRGWSAIVAVDHPASNGSHLVTRSGRGMNPESSQKQSGKETEVCCDHGISGRLSGDNLSAWI
jgi:hypothetical protein